MSIEELAARGGGKYDEEVRELMDRLQAQGVVLIVVQGTKGSGFSLASTSHAIHFLPDVLEGAAEDMRRHLAKREPEPH